MNTHDSASSKDPTSSARQYNTRLGLILFAIYTLVYSGFVLINALNADVMETIVVAGLNLAIVYGFLLIVFAFVLAMIYGVMCRREPLTSSSTTSPAKASTEAGDHAERQEDSP